MMDSERREEAAADISANGHAIGAFVIGATIGATVGALFALLYAPSSGARTRRYLTKKARAGQRHLDALIDQGSEAMKDLRSHVV